MWFPPGSEPIDKGKSVCLFGASLDNGNLGVQALAASLIKLIVKVHPEARISLLYGGRQDLHTQSLDVADNKVNVNVLNYRMSPRAKLRTHILWILLLACLQKLLPSKGLRERIVRSNPMLNLLYHSDLIGDIRGGDSFSDIYGLKGFVQSNLPLLIVKLLGKKYVLLPQTYGPFDAFLSRVIARFILTGASRLYARDLISLKLLEDMIPARKGEELPLFCPDVAFFLDSKIPEQLEVKPPLDLDRAVELVGLNVSGLLYSGGFTRDNMFGLRFSYKSFINDLARKLLENNDHHLFLVPHTWGSANRWELESDPYACNEVLKALPMEYRSRVHLIARNYSLRETKGIIGLCSFFIGSRMHACIAAISQGVPTVGVAYSRKFRGVFNSVGLGDMVLDGCSLDLGTTIDAILRLYRDRDTYRQNMTDRVDAAKRQLEERFRELFREAGQTGDRHARQA